MIKICWLIFCDAYGKLRLQKGCENLSDLEAVKKDKLEILKIAKGLGIKEEYSFVRDNPSLKQLTWDSNAINKIFIAFMEK